MSGPAQFNISLVLRADVANAKSGLLDVTAGMQAMSAEAGRSSAATRKQATDLQSMAAAAVQAISAQERLAAAEQRVQETRTRAIAAPLANPGQAFSPLQAVFKTTDSAAGSLQVTVRGLGATIGSQAQDMIEGAAAARAYQRSLDEIRASFNPLFAASREYEAQLERISQAEKLNAISAREAAAARADAARIIAPLSQPGGPAQRGGGLYAANIGAQGFDIATTAAMGMNPFMIGIQQGGQLAGIAQQLGGGTKAAKELFGGLRSIFNLTSLLTIGLTVLAAVGIQALTKLWGETKSWDDHLGDLEATLGRMKANLDRVGNTRLSEVFGDLTPAVRGLAQGLIDLNRASELKSLQSVVDGFLGTEIDPSWWQSALSGVARRGGPVANPDTMGALTPREENYAALGAGIGYDDFLKRTASISALAKSGDVEAVTKSLADLTTAMSGGQAATDMSSELRKLLGELAEAGIKTAEIEAMLNGSAQANAIQRQSDQMVLGYRQAAEMAAAVAAFGQDSIAVEQVRARHAREVLDIRLEEIGVQKDSAEWDRVHAALNSVLSEQVKAVVETQRRALADRMNAIEAVRLETSLIGASNAERLRAKALAEAELQIEKEKLGWLDAILRRQFAITKATEDARLAREKALYDIGVTGQMDGFDARIAAERSPMVRIALETEKEYVRQIAAGADAQVAAAAAAQVRARGLADLRQEQMDFLQSQDDAILQQRLELALIGQTAEVRARVLALAQAERDIQRLGYTGDEAESVRRNALIQSELAASIDAQADAWQRVQSAGESAVDAVLDRLRAGDVKGALRGLLSEIEQGFFDLAIRNPLKNAIFGTNLGTWSDVGGWGGIWGRLTGQNPVDERALAMQSVAPLQSMSVTAANVVIGGPGAASLFGGAGASSSFSDLGGSGDVQSQIWSFFAAKGLQPFQIAAIMGNVAAESAFNPLAVGDNGNAFGLFQWNDRAPALFDAIGGRGNLGNVQAQLEFAWRELMTSENGVLQRLLASNNLYDANAAFVGFERPQGWTPGNPQGAMHWDQRMAAAEAAMRAFEGQVYATGQGVGQLGTGAAALGNNLQGFGAQLGGLLQGIGAQYGPLGSLAGGLLSWLVGGAPGFDKGGWTGAGAPSDVAGLVHAEEYVFDANSTRRIGVANLEAIRRGAMRGYRDGGFVTGGLPSAFAGGAGSRGAGSGRVAGTDDRRVAFDITVSGTGSAEIRQTVHTAIATAFDLYSREVLPVEVKSVIKDRWS